MLSAVYSFTGGGKSVDFFRNFRHTYFSGFSRYNSDQVVKKHLLDQENWLARTRSARARLRARKPRPRPVVLEKSRKFFKLWVTYFGAQRARNRARPSSARQSILLIMEMIFDYLIASLAQKSEKIQSFEIFKFCKNLKFWKFSDFLKFSNFKPLYFFGFLS